MAWIVDEPVTLDARRELVVEWCDGWAGVDDAVLGIWQDGEVVGSTGLHRRGWPDGVEIGVQVDKDR